MKTMIDSLVPRPKRWTGNATIGLGATAIFVMAAAGLVAVILVFGAAARLLVHWGQYYPK